MLVRKQILVPAALDKKIRQLAQNRGISQSALIVEAVEALFGASGQGRPPPTFHRHHQRRTAEALRVCRRHLPLTLDSERSAR
jgi:hypothetical protein